jgi:predicted transcriptional regulator
MKVIWLLRQATVADVVAALGGDSVSYSTVQTMLRILENKGYVAHSKSGRAFIYRPVVGQKQARRRALQHLVARFFDNSPSLLVLNVLEDKQIDPREIERLRKLLEAQED